MEHDFWPEGNLIAKRENKEALTSINSIVDSKNKGKLLEAKAVLFDTEKNLHIQLSGFTGIIPFSESGLDGTKEISLISKVGKPVCFVIDEIVERPDGFNIVLSRRKAQLKCLDEFLSRLVPGDIINGRITHIERFGCFVDIGCGIPALLPIDNISVSRISSPFDRFCVSQSINVVVKSRDTLGRILLSHKELLGTWEQNASKYKAGETVIGTVRSIEEYGIFVELTPNLVGLAEKCSGVKVGMTASVYIKSIIPERMKIKLIIVDAFETPDPIDKPEYYISEGHIDRFVYSPANCNRLVETIF